MAVTMMERLDLIAVAEKKNEEEIRKYVMGSKKDTNKTLDFMVRDCWWKHMSALEDDLWILGFTVERINEFEAVVAMNKKRWRVVLGTHSGVLTADYYERI